MAIKPHMAKGLEIFNRVLLVILKSNLINAQQQNIM